MSRVEEAQVGTDRPACRIIGKWSQTNKLIFMVDECRSTGIGLA